MDTPTVLACSATLRRNCCGLRSIRRLCIMQQAYTTRFTFSIFNSLQVCKQRFHITTFVKVFVFHLTYFERWKDKIKTPKNIKKSDTLFESEAHLQLVLHHSVSTIHRQTDRGVASWTVCLCTNGPPSPQSVLASIIKRKTFWKWKSFCSEWLIKISTCLPDHCQTSMETRGGGGG